jgi:hypothetical protein
MKEIVKPNGEVYCYVSVEDGILKIKLNNGSAAGMEVRLDAKIIPQLRSILAEADFFKTL